MSTEVTASVQEARTRLLKHFDDHASDPSTGWSALWDEGDFLPWDKGFPSPALEDILQDRHDLIGAALIDSPDGGTPIRKTALVPGCGKGVDVLLLASFGYDAVGLEVSESAVKAAENFRKEHANEERYQVKEKAVGMGSINFVHGDFFKEDWLEKPGQTFDLIYDYTFLSALPPSLRPSWSKAISRLLSPSPMGNLICLEFPTYKDPLSGGPPFATPSKAYMEYLSHPGEEIPLGKDGHVLAQPLRETSPGGLERIAHWKPERTHEVGKDENGNVRDMVSIWRTTSY